MRKFVFTWSLMLIGLSVVNAQTEKGRWTVGTSVGNFTYQTNRNSNFTVFSVSLTPSAGYFVANNLLLGVGVPLSYGVSKGDNNYKGSNTGVGLSPYIRYYVGASRLKPYVGASAGYSRSWTRYRNPLITSTAEGSSTAIAPTIGLAYFINRSVALNAGLNYNIESSKHESLRFDPTQPVSPESRSDYRSLSLGIGFQLFFGE